MSNDNVLPFRKRPPSAAELQYYRMITRNWHPQMREALFPEHFKHDAREKQEPGLVGELGAPPAPSRR